jgi:UPF0755 protein
MSLMTRSGGRRRFPRTFWWAIGVVLLLLVAGTALSRHFYNQDLGPVSSSQQIQIFTVEQGIGLKQIAANLHKKHLIRSAWAFELYVHGKGKSASLQAGSYAFTPSQSTPEIADIMTKGRVSTRLVTILPGRRIDQVRADLINYGFAPAAVDHALDPSLYADLPVVSYLPAGNNLEGLLWPESFEKGPDTPPEDIIRQSLTLMGQHVTPDLQAAFAAEGLTPYQGITLASIVTQEVNKPADQAQAAQVFMSRLRNGTALGSDVTARYGAIAAGQSPSNLSYDSPYNTHLHTGLPPSPISTVTANALDATAHPANTNWLFFVTGDDGTTHFSSTLEQHQALTKQYCHKLCGN